MFCLFAGNIGEKNSKWSWGGNGSWVRLQLPRPSVPEMTEGTCRNPSCSVWSELHRALHSATAWKRELFFFFSSLQKVFRKSGGGAIPFLFCYNGPLCGDARGKSCVPALCGLCCDSQSSFSGLLTGTGPACGESGEGLGRDGADGSAQRSCYSPAVRAALPHRGMESD